jgi:calcineurin-like phosphoesterase family protein
MDWFTADWHVGHRNISKLCNRPFADLDEMHAALIDNWNARVKKTDTVYHLGDFCFGGHKRAFEIIEQLNGKIYFVPGSHDEWIKNFSTSDRIEILPPIHEIKYKNTTTIDCKGNLQYLWIVLCHYPMQTWSRSHYGSISLHGHCHGALKNEPPRSMDVGVDCHNYAPISLDEVISILAPMETRKSILTNIP